MNLKLNFTENPFPALFEKYSKPAFEIEDDKKICTIYNLFQNSEHYFDTIVLTDLESYYKNINKEDFAHETGMDDIINFRERLIQFDERYGWPIRNTGMTEYHFNVTKAFNWKRGIYDAMRAYVDWCEKREMKPYGITGTLRRYVDGNRSITFFQEALDRVENARRKAKESSVTMIDNIEDMVEAQGNSVDKILNNTHEANKMSDYFDIYNYVKSGDCYLNDKLVTLVKTYPKEMTIIRTDNEVIGKILVPETYIVFHRPLYKALAEAKRTSIFSRIANPGRQHPYSHASAYYARDISDESMTNNPWGTLCLSSYCDDILSPLERNDFSSFLMGLSSWNSIYNIESTNPYYAPNKVLYDIGFHKDMSIAEICTLSTHVNYNTVDCFNHNLFNYSIVEDDIDQRRMNSDYNNDRSIYSKYIIAECDEKNCSFRNDCSGYSNAKQWLNHFDFEEITESFVGIIDELEGMNMNSDKSSRYQYVSSKIMSNHLPIDYIYETLANINYWTVYEPLSEEDEIKAKMTAWHNQINEEGETRHVR